jgi:DNA-binding transcriptional LysR family regulator
MLHLRQYQCALAVAEHGSFQRAAERLGITPSGLTQSIQRLEAHYGAPLFNRGRNGITPTPAGEIAIEGARAILNRAAAVDREIELLGSPGTGHLSIGADPTLSNAVLGPVLTRLMRTAPSLRFSVNSGSRTDLMRGLAERAIDLVLCYPDPTAVHTGQTTVDLMTEAPIVVARPDHPIRRLKERKLYEYFRYPRVGAHLPAWYLAWAEFQMARDGQPTGVNQDYSVFGNDIQMLKTIVRDTDAVMGIFRPDVELELKEGLLVELNPTDWPRQVPMEIVYSSERPLPEPARAVVDALSKAHPRG